MSDQSREAAESESEAAAGSEAVAEFEAAAGPEAESGAPKILFAEPGGRWRTVAYGPLLCAAILFAELSVGGPVHWFALLFCAALIAAFVVVQVIAARRHVSVELTPTTLRQGTETLGLDEIAQIYPERDEEAWDDEPWESARALGELTGVPRRHTGIGVRLVGGGMVQAWAKDHRALRAELTAATRQERVPEAEAVAESAATADAPQADVSAVEVDAAGPEADVSAVEVDIAGPEADVSAVEVDAAGPEADVSAVEVDAAGPEADATAVEVDIAGPEGVSAVEVDTATAEVGMSAVEADTATVAADLPAVAPDSAAPIVSAKPHGDAV